MMGASQVKSMRVVRLRVSMLHAFVSMPPVRLLRRLMMFPGNRMLLVRHLVVWGCLMVFPCPPMLRSRGCWGCRGWSLVSQFMRHRGMACPLHHWPVAHLWRSLYDWYITGRNLSKAPGCQRGNHIRPDGLVLVALAVEVMPRLQIERFLCFRDLTGYAPANTAETRVFRYFSAAMIAIPHGLPPKQADHVIQVGSTLRWMLEKISHP